MTFQNKQWKCFLVKSHENHSQIKGKQFIFLGKLSHAIYNAF